MMSMYDLQYVIYKLAKSHELGNFSAAESWLNELTRAFPFWFRKLYDRDSYTRIGDEHFQLLELHQKCIAAAKDLYRQGSPVALEIKEGQHSFQKLYASNLGDGIVEVVYECAYCGEHDYDEYQSGELVHSAVPLFCKK